ncbi:hypothetical protein G7Z17_g5625 [Cylindrodendrum hubeiense]|uniref:Uncharacterized protein n=1 Tax=Cylindrodendrum hubeiense TaxID=595255 RepID=A0A9P5HCK8_9HYPO|nr:hypothetical protein G7Z17_g5625 [Cylindrodendrum hubeiense]
MAPFEHSVNLVARYYCNSYYSNCNSRWHSWGRWVVAAIAAGLFLLVLFSCLLVSRRRRNRGVQPIYGTGWMAPGKYGNQPNNHQMYDYNQQGGQFQQQQAYGGYPPAPPPPAYGQQQQPQYTGTTFDANDGYYGQHNQQPPPQHTGVQPLQGTYQREEVYSPPQGPPPGK